MSAQSEPTCEMRVRGAWEVITLDDALNRFDASREKRCIECHGQVRAHRLSSNGMKAHFEHYERHDGCSLGNSFSGARARHRRPLE